MMKLLSINVSLPVTVEQAGKTFSSAIFKKPVTGPVFVHKMNLAGDRQADLKNHGGEDKAVYAFSFDHYAYWGTLLHKPDMPYGQFGENLTIAGLDEASLYIGDHLKIGSCLLEISQPRIPCFKLGIIMGTPDMPRLFIEHGATGIYFRVLQEGEIFAGNPVDIVSRGKHRLAVKTLFTSYFDPDLQNPGVLETALEIPELAAEWREKILKKLAIE
jgi:MOSC domain-containing protein YiiM